MSDLIYKGKHKQTLKLKTGSIIVCNHRTRHSAVCHAVDFAISSGANPRIHWWEFWKDVWPSDCVEQYLKKTRR